MNDKVLREEGESTMTATDELPPPPPQTRLRRKLPAVTIGLAIAAAAGIGFFAGVRVEKAQLPTRAAASTTGFTAGNARAAGNAFGAGATASPAAGSSANIIGTISVIDGDTLYISETSGGNVVKVTTTDGTTVTTTNTGKVKDLTPGESVVVRGVESSSGVYAAQTVTEGNAAAGGGFAGFGGRGARGGQGSGAGPSTTPSAQVNAGS